MTLPDWRDREEAMKTRTRQPDHAQRLRDACRLAGHVPNRLIAHIAKAENWSTFAEALGQIPSTACRYALADIVIYTDHEPDQRDIVHNLRAQAARFAKVYRAGELWRIGKVGHNRAPGHHPITRDDCAAIIGERMTRVLETMPGDYATIAPPTTHTEENEPC